MTETPSDLPKHISLSIIDTWKLKLPSVYLALPPDFINQVGAIVISWGMFEKAFEDLLTAMLLETTSIYKGWQFFSFEQKRSIFETELPKCFATAPDLSGRLAALIADTYTLQIKRNVLVHGKITLKIDGTTPLLVAKGEFKKKLIEETFSKESITDLYYDIIHLAGRMAQFVKPDAGEFLPPLTSTEKSILRDVLSKNPTPQSSVSMMLPLRRPLPE